MATAAQVQPHLAGTEAIPEPGVPNVLQQREDLRVAQCPLRSLPGGVVVVGARGDRAAVLAEHPADRLDPELVLVLADVVDDHRYGRSSSAAKKADALFRMSLARRSSRPPSSTRGSPRCSSLVRPGRVPPSTSARRTHLRTVSGEPIPNLAAIDRIASNSLRYWSFDSITSRTARTARVRSSPSDHFQRVASMGRLIAPSAGGRHPGAAGEHAVFVPDFDGSFLGQVGEPAGEAEVEQVAGGVLGGDVELGVAAEPLQRFGADQRGGAEQLRSARSNAVTLNRAPAPDPVTAPAMSRSPPARVGSRGAGTARPVAPMRPGAQFGVRAVVLAVVVAVVAVAVGVGVVEQVVVGERVGFGLQDQGDPGLVTAGVGQLSGPHGVGGELDQGISAALGDAAVVLGAGFWRTGRPTRGTGRGRLRG